MKSKYQIASHAKTSLRYHIIFSTKYRTKCLTQIKDEVFASFRYAEGKSQFKILQMNLDKDHIHLLITWPPVYSIEQVINRLKQLTTNYLWIKCEAHMKKYYWSKKRKLWTHGYFISTIGDVSEKTLKEYIANQG